MVRETAVKDFERMRHMPEAAVQTKSRHSINGYIKRFSSEISPRGLFRMFAVPGSFDTLFFVLVIFMLGIGLVMLYSASYPYAYYKTGDSAFYIKRQLFFAVPGVVGMLVVSRFNMYKRKLAVSFISYVGCLAMLCIVLLMPSQTGIRRWIYIGGQQFQPSELAKLALILMCAFMLDEYQKEIEGKTPLKNPRARYYNRIFGNKPWFNESLKPIIITIAYIGVFTVLLLAESHLSGTILMGSIGIIMLLLGGVRKKWFVVGAVLLVVGMLFIYFFTDMYKDYMAERVYSWRNKDFEPLGARWQTNQALYAIGSGGLFGVGLGSSKQKFMYVSEPQNDMIFSIVCEELGFIGAAIILIGFALLIWRGIVIGINARDRYGALVSMGIVIQLGMQVILNIFVATDFIPNTGISLPFFSYGGTSLFMMLIEMGMVLSISRTSRLKKNEKVSESE